MVDSVVVAEELLTFVERLAAESCDLADGLCDCWSCGARELLADLEDGGLTG